jgi:hypothetical protein
MGRILVLLTFAGLAAAFVIIYNTSNQPVQSAVPSNSNGPAQGNTRSTKASQVDKKGRTSLPRSVSGRGNPRHFSKAGATPTEDVTEAPKPAAAKRESIDSRSDSTVKSDSTPVYSANTKRSKVLRSLKRGEKLPPDLEVIDSEGRWRLVRGSGKGKPGFVREEQIERPGDTVSSKSKPPPEQPKQ